MKPLLGIIRALVMLALAIALYPIDLVFMGLVVAMAILPELVLVFCMGEVWHLPSDVQDGVGVALVIISAVQLGWMWTRKPPAPPKRAGLLTRIALVWQWALLHAQPGGVLVEFISQRFDQKEAVER